ncbi:MAG: hypothetical protein IMF11_16395 [Proteobacteria bacterium]|nr:hypothetical protein [Pseudomonadota bacterium]
MRRYASYEKSIEATVTTVKHTVRILLNSDRSALENALRNVPYAAKVSMIVDDTESENYGEIIFTEEI